MACKLVTSLSDLPTNQRLTIQGLMIPSETPQKIISDVYMEDVGNGIIVLTNQRIIFLEVIDLRWSGIASLISRKPRTVIFPYANIVTVDKERKLLVGLKIEFTLIENTWRLIFRQNEQLAESTWETIQKNMAIAKNNYPAVAHNSSERLQELEELHQSGQITDAEYQTKRQQIIDQL